MTRSPEHYLQYMRQHAADFAAVRQQIHQHPELGYEEHATSELVANRLLALGYQVERGLGGTGVVGQLRRGSGPRSIGIRADMDALPIEEKTGLSYSSSKPGLMHACGHDGHTATLLAAAQFLAEQGRFSGTLNLIFQPAEESLAGARRMMDDGLFARYPCDAIFALHNMPGLPQGQLAFREGAAMASSDYATVTITGVGGHGAMPQQSVDPIVAAASIVMALQTICSRNTDPRQTAVVTVGALHAGRANNVIAQTATLEISMRALHAPTRALLRQRLHDIVQAQARSFGAQARIDFVDGYPVLVNTEAETRFAVQTAKELFGAGQVQTDVAPMTGSEDFAYMLEQRPGCYLFVGNGLPGEPGGCMVHNPGYDFNDANLVVGAAYWAMLTEKYLA